MTAIGFVLLVLASCLHAVVRGTVAAHSDQISSTIAISWIVGLVMTVAGVAAKLWELMP